MDLNSAIVKLNKLLNRKNPKKFNATWIIKYAPDVYRFIHKNIRTGLNEIDWDRVTMLIDRKFQKRWVKQRKKPTDFYRNKKEVEIALGYYKDKKYTFFTNDKEDKNTRYAISIILVRTAQKGNLSAKKELKKLVNVLIYDWIENNSLISRWQGHEELIDKYIDICIRRYRYSGSFIGYLFKTLEYTGRGFPRQYSLNNPSAATGRTMLDFVIKDEETGDIKMYERN